MKRKTWLTLVKLALGLSLLAWVVWSNWRPEGKENEGLAAALARPIYFGPFLIGLAICLVGILITFVRWYVLVRAQQLPFTLRSAFRLGFIGIFLNTFLPGSVGGDIIKAAFLAREQSRRTVAVATVVVDRIIGLCGLFWLASFIGGIFLYNGGLEQLAYHAPNQPWTLTRLLIILIGLIGISLGSLLFWLVFGLLTSSTAERFASRLEHFPKIGGSLAELWRAVWMYRCQGSQVLVALLLAMLGHIGFILTYYCAALTLFPASELPSPQAQFLLTPVGMTIQAGFPTPSGLGGGELAFSELYKLVGYASAAGVLGILVKRVIDWILGLLGFLSYLRIKATLPVETANPQTPA